MSGRNSPISWTHGAGKSVSVLVTQEQPLVALRVIFNKEVEAATVRAGLNLTRPGRSVFS